MTVAIVVSAAITAAIAGCGGGGGSSTDASGNLKTAIAYLPSDASASYTFEFADWSRVEQALGIEPSQLTSASAISKITRVLHKVAEQGGGAPLTMTGFQPTFNLTSVGTHLAGCGFTAKKVGGITLYSGSTGAMLKCAGPFGSDIPTETQYGIDAANHAVLMSMSPTAVTDAIRARQANRTAPAIPAIIDPLKDDQAIAGGVGPKFCARLSGPNVFVGRLAAPALVARAEKAFPPARPYLAFGFGLTVTPAAASGQIVFAYADARSAKQDLADRQHRLETESSFVVQQPYANLVRAVSGHTAGDSAVLQIAQPPGQPIQLNNMFNQSDLGFARCG